MFITCLITTLNCCFSQALVSKYYLFDHSLELLFFAPVKENLAHSRVEEILNSKQNLGNGIQIFGITYHAEKQKSFNFEIKQIDLGNWNPYYIYSGTLKPEYLKSKLLQNQNFSHKNVMISDSNLCLKLKLSQEPNYS